MAITEFRGHYGCLSNFYTIPFSIFILVFDNRDFPLAFDSDLLASGVRKYEGNYIFHSVEAAYQACKCAKHEDFCKFPSLDPSRAKKLGKKVELREDWDSVKLEIMEQLVRQKFTGPKSEMCKMILLGTGDEEIIEGNTWGDTFWGVCNGIGENHLGKILMKIREEINERRGV